MIFDHTEEEEEELRQFDPVDLRRQTFDSESSSDDIPEPEITLKKPKSIIKEKKKLKKKEEKKKSQNKKCRDAYNGFIENSALTDRSEANEIGLLYDNESELTDSELSQDEAKPTIKDIKNRLTWDTKEFDDSSSEGEIRIK